VASNRRARLLAQTAVGLIAAWAGLGCQAGAGTATAPIVAGASAAPREVNLITRDYAFVPEVLELVPGETILLHVINGGLVVHEAVIGDAAVQDAWEVAEAATLGAPPGPTPVVVVPDGLAGLRVVVESGQRVDVTWTVPVDPGGASAGHAPWFVGCHIPGHLAKGMVMPVRWVSTTVAPS
jgi:uncharacterized cupredoxin-like copper-binding protein